MLALATLALGAHACTDTDSRYRDFLERTDDRRNLDAGMVEPGDRVDFSGRYLLALSTSLAPDEPLLFEVQVEVASDLTSLDMSFQPLTSDEDDEPRTPVGEPFSLQDVPYDEDGSFEADLGEVEVPGRANPITGSDISAQVQLAASTHDLDDAGADAFFCGQASGNVVVPISFDLAGSSFGAVLAEDLQDAEPLLRCP